VQIAAAFLVGALFSLGLAISGMINPEKVLGFLDVAGAWDPALAFVMAGAVGVNVVGYRLAWRRPHPLLADRFALPTRTDIDRPLIAGAATFGLGWGLAGFCPGPAIAALGVRPVDAGVFVAAMLAGMAIGRLRGRNQTRAPQAA